MFVEWILITLLVFILVVYKFFTKRLIRHIKQQLECSEKHIRALEEYKDKLLQEEREHFHRILMADDDSCLSRNFWFDFDKLMIRHYPPATGVFSCNGLYSWTLDMFDGLRFFDYDLPIMAVNEERYITINGWEIHPECYPYLRDGIIDNVEMQNTEKYGEIIE